MKPMNCPHHMQIFADNQFSYRDMPVRYFEPATVYRDEKSGQLSGLTRVRAITQDDGHLFCRVDQIKDEVKSITDIIKEFYRICKNQSVIDIRVPHPRHDDFISDPTHVRPITILGLQLYDKELNNKWEEGKFSNTPLALIHNVNFKILNDSNISFTCWDTSGKKFTKSLDFKIT